MDRDFVSKYGPGAIVTGASSGIGESFARLLAEEGLDLLLVARRIDRLSALAAALESDFGVGVRALEADLGDAASVGAVVEVARSLDIGLVVNNAGYRIPGAHHTLDAAQLSNMLGVNCVAPTLLVHQCIPHLLERGRGGLLFTGSIEAAMGFPGSGAYAASKAFIRSLGEALWGELESRGIDVLVLEPGATDTENLARQGVDRELLGTIMHPDEVARIGLENLANGPVLIAGDENAKFVEALTSAPRREGLRNMARTLG